LPHGPHRRIAAPRTLHPPGTGRLATNAAIGGSAHCDTHIGDDARTGLTFGNSHSEELLEIPEGVKVTIKTRNVVVEGERRTGRSPQEQC
jgi:hypothetical protein